MEDSKAIDHPYDPKAKPPSVTPAAKPAVTDPTHPGWQLPGDTTKPLPGLFDNVNRKISQLSQSDYDGKAVQAWWLEYRRAIVSVSPAQLVGILQSRVNGTTAAELLVLNRGLSPSELNTVLSANASSVSAMPSDRGREAALMRLVDAKLSAAQATLLLDACAGVPV